MEPILSRQVDSVERYEVDEGKARAQVQVGSTVKFDLDNETARANIQVSGNIRFDETARAQVHIV